jgi:hypothetical protein
MTSTVETIALHAKQHADLVGRETSIDAARDSIALTERRLIDATLSEDMLAIKWYEDALRYDRTFLNELLALPASDPSVLP